MRTQPKYHVSVKDTKQLKSGKVMTVNFIRIGTQPRKTGQMLSLSDLRRAK
jgi:hypothetical protein